MAKNPFLKIFLVDDDIFCLTLYKQFLGKLDYSEVLSFTSGQDCLEKLDDHPNIAFLDYNMEGLNGIDVLKKIKQFDPLIRVYIISGQEDPEIAASAIKNGAEEYIVKSSINPARMKEIMESIEEMMPIVEKQTKMSFFQRMKAGLKI